MKIRIKGNSIRIRLTKTEVDTFGKKGMLEDRTEFGDGEFVYALCSIHSGDGLTATIKGNRITMWVPEKMKEEWTSTGLVGMQNKISTGPDKSLFLLLEKDFVCIDNTFEDQSDNYPNPNAVC